MEGPSCTGENVAYDSQPLKHNLEVSQSCYGVHYGSQVIVTNHFLRVDSYRNMKWCVVRSLGKEETFEEKSVVL